VHPSSFFNNDGSIVNLLFEILKFPARSKSPKTPNIMGNFNENDIVLCTVDKIDGTTVFVILEDGSQGAIVTSEIAPGRIRNIREYVSPNKKMVGVSFSILRHRRVDIELLFESWTSIPMGAVNKIVMAISIDGRVRQRLSSSLGDIREPAWGPFLR
jgi:hypothetical protein